jgi:head-tail adaptor
MIGQMNCLIEVQSVSVSQNTDGDIEATPSAAWNKWADIKQNSGNLGITQGMGSFNESFRVQMWYEPTRPTLPNYILTYNGKTMKVVSVDVDNEGNRKVENIIADTSN